MTYAREQPGVGASRLEIVKVGDQHSAELAEFIKVVWDPDATAASVLAARAAEAAANVAEPGTPPPTWIALQLGRVLGYVTTIPIRLWDGEREWPGYWIKGLMVHPEFRNGPVGFLVLKAAVASLPRTGALAVAPPARRLFEALGYHDLGAIKNWIRPLRLSRLLNRVELPGLGLVSMPGWAGRSLNLARTTGLATILGGVGGAALRGSAAALRLPATHLDRNHGEAAPSATEIDELWRTASVGIRSGVVRDSRYLLHRYPSGAGSPYRWLTVRRRGVLAGLGILRCPRPDSDPRLRGIRMATLADALYPPGEFAVGLALLGAAERSARAEDADALLASSPTPVLQSLLRKQWYLPIAGNVHFLLRDVTEAAPRFGTALREWWLTRGDGSADDVF